MTTLLSELYTRDITKLTEELKLYKSEDEIWQIKEGISNSAGNLALHLIGNLNYFIGTILAGNGYVRERDKEFSEKNIPLAVLIEDLQKIIPLIKDTLANLPDEKMKEDFPVPLGGKTLSTEGILVFLLAHFNYHLGQVNYHRRLLS